VDFFVENSRSKCDRLFLLHSQWIVSVQVAAYGFRRRGGLSTG
jgi:hypothetical protein